MSRDEELAAMREEMVETFLREAPKGTTRAQVDRAIPLPEEFAAARRDWPPDSVGGVGFANHYRTEIWARLAVEIELDKRIAV